MIAAWLTLWTLPFWLFLGGIFILELWAIEKENGFGALIILVCCLVFLLGFGDIEHPFLWMAHNWLMLLAYIFLYILVGAGWGILRWMFYYHDRMDVYEENKAAYQEQYTAYRRAEIRWTHKTIAYSKIGLLKNAICRPHLAGTRNRFTFGWSIGHRPCFGPC